MSTQSSLAQDRVVDPIYTEVARGYGFDYAPVANILFPVVPVRTTSGNIITFGPEDWVLYNSKRAPGQNTKRIQFGHAGAPYALDHHRLEALVPNERAAEAAAQPGLDLVTRSIRSVQRLLDLERENISATLARNTANYAAGSKVVVAAPDKWTNSGSDPVAQVEAAKSAVRGKVGQKPTHMIIGDAAYTALAQHPNILDRLSDSAIKIATLEQLQQLFRMTILVGEGVYYDPVATAFVDIWGNDVILAVVAKKSAQDMGSPNFGYTYQLENFPVVEDGYEDRNANSWIYPLKDAYRPVLTGATSGYLFQAAV